MTDADPGIGYAVAEASLEFGATVTISSSKQDRLDKAVAKLKASYPDMASRISGYACDLGDEDNVEDNIRDLFAKTGRIDHVVLTAGDGLSVVPLEHVTIPIMRKAAQVRLFAAILVAKHAVKYLTPAPKSSITFTGGELAERPLPDWTLISGFAAAMPGIVKGLALDLKPIRVNVVQPGVTDTGIFSATGVPDEVKQGIFAEAKGRLLLGKVGTPEDLAESYIYFMRDEFATGSVANSNGGSLVV